MVAGDSGGVERHAVGGNLDGRDIGERVGVDTGIDDRRPSGRERSEPSRGIDGSSRPDRHRRLTVGGSQHQPGCDAPRVERAQGRTGEREQVPLDVGDALTAGCRPRAEGPGRDVPVLGPHGGELRHDHSL